MNNPFLRTVQSRLIYVGSWVLFFCIQLSLLYFYFSDLGLSLILDLFINNLLLAGCILLIWFPLRYNRTILNGWLFFAFHVVLAFVVLSVWMGLSYLLLKWDPYLIPLHLFLGLMIYLIAVLIYYLSMTVKEQETEVAKEESTEEILSRIAVKRKQEIRVIPVDDILYLAADGDYVHLHTMDGSYLKEKTMKYWESHLPQDQFVRIHRSSIVNVDYIAKIELYEKEIYRVHLKNGISLRSSVTGYKLLRQKVQI